MDYMPQFGQNIPNQTVGAQDDATAQLLLKRRLAQADLLRNQEMPQGQMVSGHYVAPSWTQYLANLTGNIAAGKQEEQAIKGYQDYQKSQSQKLGALLDDLSKGKAITEQGTYDIQVPNGKTPTSNENLGGMQPYESGQKTIQVPMTTTTGYTPYTQQEFMSKVGQVMPSMLPKMLETQFENRFKEEQPIVAHAGDVGFNRKGEKIFAVPEKAKEEKIFGTVNPGDFTPTSLAKFAATGGKDYSVLVPNPKNTGENKPPAGYRWGADGSLVAIKGGPADKPLKEIPPTARQAYAGNQASLQQIDEAIKAVEDAPPEYFGLQAGLGNTYMSRRYPESVGVRQKVNGVASVKRHDLLGGAVTPSENASTAPLIPQPNDDKNTTLTKLKGLRENYASTNHAIAGSFGDEYTPLEGTGSNGFTIKRIP